MKLFFGTQGTPYAIPSSLTGAVNLSKALGGGWVIDFSYSFYRQKASWRIGGSGSQGIDTFSARWFEVGLSVTY